MRLTLVNLYYVPDISPTAHMAASLAEHRAALGDRVTVLAGTGAYVPVRGDPGRLSQANPRVVRLWTPSLGKSSAARRVIDYAIFYLLACLRLAFLPCQDVVLLMTTPPYIALAGLLHKLLHPRTRLILWSMDCYPETAERAGVIRQGSWVSRGLRALNRFLYRRLDGVVCLDEAMRDLLQTAYTQQGRPIFHVIRNWESAARFPPDLHPPPWSGEGDSLLKGRFVVLYLGNAGTGHRFETVLDAAEALRDLPVSFLFVGGGSAWPDLREAVDSRQLPNVALQGYVAKETTPSVLAAAHASLITLKDEMLGVMAPSKLHAYLAMGLPVIYVGPAGGNVDEAIRRFGCGVSLRHGDTEGFSAFLRRMIETPGFREGLARRARAAFDQAYCDSVTLPQFDAVLDGTR